jgi:hypothetical protein
VPEASYGIVGRGRDEMHPFRPTAPSRSMTVNA